jgi:SAM-dependent methyltransferase
MCITTKTLLLGHVVSLEGAMLESPLRYLNRGLFLAWIVLGIIPSLSAASQESAEKGQHHRRPQPEEVHEFEQQKVVLEDFEAEGYILALGGGGEGIIGQLKGQQVIAIDINERELEEAPPGPLKMVMDARDLKFLDQSFETAATFFTLMYIDGADHKKVLDETYRVLTSGGRFLIWDALFGARPSDEKKYGVVPLTIKLPRREVQTGYGVRWPSEPHDLEYYERLAKESGFEIGESKVTQRWFFLELRKP